MEQKLHDKVQDAQQDLQQASEPRPIDNLTLHDLAPWCPNLVVVRPRHAFAAQSPHPGPATRVSRSVTVFCTRRVADIATSAKEHVEYEEVIYIYTICEMM